MANHRKIDSFTRHRRPGTTDEYLTVAEAIVEAIEIGATHQTAAKYAGVNQGTLSMWLTRGADHLTHMAENDLEDPEELEEPYVKLWLEVNQAEAIGEVELIGTTRAHAGKDWRAGAWMLSRRYEGTWADRPAHTQIGVQVTTGGAPTMSHAEALQLRAELEARRAELQANSRPELSAAIDVKEAS